MDLLTGNVSGRLQRYLVTEEESKLFNWPSRCHMRSQLTEMNSGKCHCDYFFHIGKLTILSRRSAHCTDYRNASCSEIAEHYFHSLLFIFAVKFTSI